LTFQGVIYFENMTRFHGTCTTVTSHTSYEQLGLPTADFNETQKRHQH